MAWAVCWLQVGLAQAQSIDVAQVRARVGAPIEVVLRVRATDIEPGASLSRCVQATVFHGQDAGAVSLLRVVQSSTAADGELWVTLRDEESVREPVVRVRTALVCGARYTREFTLLVDPPLDAPGLARDGGDAGIATGTALPGPGTVDAAASAAGGNASLKVAPRARSPKAAQAPAVAPAPKVRAAQAPAPAAAAVAPSVASSQAAAEMTAAVERLYQQLESMRDEQRRSQETLAALRERLDQTEQERDRVGESAGWMRVALLVVGGGLGLLVLPRVLGFAWLLVRYAINRRRRKPEAIGRDTRFELFEEEAEAQVDAAVAPSRWSVSVAHSAWGRDAYPPREAASPNTEAPPERPRVAPDMPPRPKVSTRAYMPVPQVLPPEEAEFDPDGLDDTRHALLLEKIDAIAAEGAPAASATLLEGALKGRIGRSPGIYLRLLDHYRQLGQPANVERVLGELCMHYNVRADLGDADGYEGAPLEQHPDIWPAIRDAWHAHGVAALLAAVIRRPSFHTPLSLAAFRDAVWLYAVARVRDEPYSRSSLAEREPLGRAA
ncbi:hypothetical protein ACWA7J_14630 [Leptothrix sp. BB-4]